MKSGRLETPGQVDSEGVPRLRKIRNSWGGEVRRGEELGTGAELDARILALTDPVHAGVNKNT